MLRLEPRDRLGLKEILGHPWYTNPVLISPPALEYFPTIESLPMTIPEESPPPNGDGQASLSGTNASLEPPQSAASEASTATWHTATSEGGDVSTCQQKDTDLTPGAGEGSRASFEAREKSAFAANADAATSTLRRASTSTISNLNSTEMSRRGSSASQAGIADSASLGYRFPPPSPFLLDRIPHGSPGLPVPAHSRTPSRTKRRSIGSSMSERLLPKEDVPVLPDYLSLLMVNPPAPFTTPQERELLDGLAALGFDTGQMIHSVRTDACDASGAVWWMLKLKQEKKEAEAREVALMSSAMTAKSTSMTSLAASVGQSTLSSDGRQTPQTGMWAPVDPPAGLTATSLQGQAKAQSHVPAAATQADASLAADHRSDALTAKSSTFEYGGPGHTPSPRKSRSYASSGSSERLSSISAPMLSPTTKRSMPEPPAVPPLPDLSYLSISAPDRTNPVANTQSNAVRDSTKPVKPATKARSASVSTVTMLQRATSALGVSVNRKDKSDETGGISTNNGEAGRSTPTINPLTSSFFGRKSSSAGPGATALASSTSTAPVGIESGLTAMQTGESSSSSHSPSSEKVAGNRSDEPYGSPGSQGPLELVPLSTPLRQRVISVAGRESPSGASVSSSEARDSPGTRAIGHSSVAGSSLRSSTTSSKSQNRTSKSLFSSFRHWFQDDRRKSRRQRQSSGPMSMAADLTSPQRQGSLRRPVVHAPSPLQRPPLARLPSNGPSSAGVSRRNSSASARRTLGVEPPSPLIPRPRRRSDASRHSVTSMPGARTPNSERGGREFESRPPSSQSHSLATAELYNAARKRHGRASSTSSTASRQSSMLAGSPVATYRRTPAVTQVKRISRHDKYRHSHSRHASNPSSVEGDNNSRRSSISLDAQKTILEEEDTHEDGVGVTGDGDEDTVAAERSRALRKLSGPAELLDAGSGNADERRRSPSPGLIPGMGPLLRSNTESDASHPRSSSERRRTHHDNHRGLRQSSSSSSHGSHGHHGHGRSASTHGPTVFAAHKVVNPFGTPNGAHFQPHSHGHTTPSRRSSEGQRSTTATTSGLRDVFKTSKPDGDSEWVDEDDGLGNYTGGFGQAGRASSSFGLGVQSGGSLIPAGTPPPPSSLFGGGRYAGLSLGGDDGTPHKTETASWRGRTGPRGPSFRRAATVTEEEEEEE